MAKRVAKKRANQRPQTRNYKMFALEEPLLDAIKRGASLNEACKYVGVSRAAAWAHAKKHKDFRRRLDQAKATCILTLLDTLRIAAADDWRAAQHLLAVLNPRRHARRAIERQAERPVNQQTTILIQQHADWYGTPPKLAAADSPRAGSAAAPAANLA